VDCGDGTKSSATVDACTYYATSKTQANRIAYSEACRRANEKHICYDDHGGGLKCQVFCKGQPTDFNVEATAKDGGDISFEITDGSLPPGLTMDESGHITGTATGGDGVATIKMTDEDGNVSSQTFCAITMSITTSSLGNGVVKSPYSATIAASGGTPPYTFSAINLPTGLTMDSSGHITGTPTQCGHLTPTFTVKDSLDYS
jgi:hypothetical protein